MEFPKLNQNATTKVNIEEFLGYNHNLRNKSGEWYNQKNMTSDYYPVASPRDKRGIQLDVRPIRLPNSPTYMQDVITNNILGMMWLNDELITLRDIIDANNVFQGAWFVNNGQLVAVEAPTLATQLTNGTYKLVKGVYYAGEFAELSELTEQRPIQVEFTDGTVLNILDKFCKFSLPNNKSIPYWEQEQTYGYLESIDETVQVKNTDNPYIYYNVPVTGTHDNQWYMDVVSTVIIPNLYIKKVPNGAKISVIQGSIDISKLKVDDYVELKCEESLGIYTIKVINTDIVLEPQSPNFNIFSPFQYKGDLDIYKAFLPEAVDKLRGEQIKYFDANNPYKRSVIRNGANVVVFPDGVVYDTTKEKDAVFKIAKQRIIFSSTGLTFRTYVLNHDTSTYKMISFITKDQTQFDSNSYRVCDGSVQQYVESSKTWVNVKTYVAIYSAYKNGYFDESVNDDFDSFNKNEVISFDVNIATKIDNLEGVFVYDEDSKSYKISDKKIVHKGIWDKTDDGTNRKYIMVEGYIKSVYAESGENVPFYNLDNTLTLTRKCPDISFACESNNRIWGCSKDGHEIYASALGLPCSWYDFSGISTDSYAVNVGTDGEFTGCCTYLGNPLFFKENSLHYITGSVPAQFSVATFNQFKGLEKGSERSLAVINNILYYKSSIGIVAFDGANTQLVSPEFGKERYTNAVAGAYDDKYYVSMMNGNGEYEMFSYDTTKRMWCKEDSTEVSQFINVKNELLFHDITRKVISSICDVNVLGNSEYKSEDDFEWECETANYGYSYPNNKYMSRFQIRMQLGAGSKASFHIQYNSNGIWHNKGYMASKGIKSYLLPIVPMRCDHMRIKVKGKGDAKIYSIAKILEEGGDVR